MKNIFDFKLSAKPNSCCLNLSKFIIIISIFLLAQNLYAQSGWFWQNPLPTGNDYEEVKFIDENIGYAVGWQGTIVKTTNGGENWFFCNNGLSGIFRCLHIFDANNVIVSGNGIFRTSNGGLNWALISNQFYSPYDIFFIDKNVGFTVLGNQFYKTTNGGYNWKSTSVSGTFWSLYFFDENTGYIAGDQGKILKTTNGGTNWILFQTGVISRIKSIQFLTEQIGFCATESRIFKTTNGGSDWDEKLNTNYHSGGQIVFSSLDTGYYCNWSGKVYKTHDGGNFWDSSTIGGLTISLASPKSNMCVVVGSGGQIFKTSTFGVNWDCVSSPFGNLGYLNNVNFPTPSVGYIFGNNGNVLKTTNTGGNWIKINSGMSNNLITSFFINKDTGFVGGTQGSIFQTLNGGLNWDSLTSVNSYTSAVVSIHFYDVNTGLISGYDKVLKTTNRGLNWYLVKSYPSANVASLQFVNDLTGFWVASKTSCIHCSPPYINLFKTTNYGENWNSISYQENLTTEDFKMVNENVGYMSLWYSTKKTTNGGVNWFQVLGNNGRGLSFINENTGYTTQGYKTSDGGNSWFYSNIGISSDLIKSICFVNSKTGFVVGGYGGTILKTTDGGGTMIPIGLNNLSEAVPMNYNISQNYPNPFNPQTKIKFAVPKASFTKLIIYDLLGREVTTLVNEELKPGTYEADWDGSNFSSGVYFYKIISSEFTETRKMVLMR